MATYVFSDVHGHRAPLERLLERVSPTDDDRIFMLGDMVDRGPDPVGVLKVCRGLKNAQVLMGNHEDLMMAYFQSGDEMAALNWGINGSETTIDGLGRLPHDERVELLDWVFSLPLCGICEAGGRLFILAHAGIRPKGPQPPERLTAEGLRTFMSEQDPEDLLWIRQEFWGQPTGLVDSKGKGPIVVTGHTPTAYLEGMADRMERSPYTEEGLCRQVRVGACEATGGVSDRWDIDSGAAGGAGFGQVSMVRLDDGEEFYEQIAKGE